MGKDVKTELNIYGGRYLEDIAGKLYKTQLTRNMHQKC